LRYFGVHGPSWLGEPEYALYAIITVAVWQDMGYNVIVFLAGLQTIPESLYEAAMVDGASGWQRFRHITVPLLSRTTLFVTVAYNYFIHAGLYPDAGYDRRWTA